MWRSMKLSNFYPNKILHERINTFYHSNWINLYTDRVCLKPPLKTFKQNYLTFLHMFPTTIWATIPENINTYTLCAKQLWGTYYWNEKYFTWNVIKVLTELCLQIPPSIGGWYVKMKKTLKVQKKNKFCNF